MPLTDTPTPKTMTLARDVVENYGALQHVTEFARFLELVREAAPKTVLEIGTHSGASIWSLAQVCPADTLHITVDICSSKALQEGPFRNTRKVKPNKYLLRRSVYPLVWEVEGRRIVRILGNSQKLITRLWVRAALAARGRQAVDLLFIDADHSYAGVSRDFALYAPLVAAGGMIVFHDILDSDEARRLDIGVPRFWTERMAETDQWRMIAFNDSREVETASNPIPKPIMGIGVLQKRAADTSTSLDRATWLYRLVWAYYRVARRTSDVLLSSLHRILPSNA